MVSKYPKKVKLIQEQHQENNTLQHCFIDCKSQCRELVARAKESNENK